MSKKIKHYVGKVNGPFVKKGEIYKKNPMNIAIDSTIMGTLKLEQYPETYEPVYEEEVLPGIVSFKASGGRIFPFNEENISYEEYVESYTNCRDITIHTISVDGVEWSVGEKVHILGSKEYTIDSFKWTNVPLIDNEFKWSVCLRSGGWDWVRELKKAPIRKPFITLKDENGKYVDLFEGDKYWYVFTEDFEIMSFEIQKSSVIPYDVSFPTKAAAEKYVFDNKPFYPRGVVDPIFNARLETYDKHVDRIEEFKNKHNVKLK
jgi:hypothetical protein